MMSMLCRPFFIFLAVMLICFLFFQMAPRLIIPAPEHFTGRVTYRGTGIFAKIKARFEEFNLNNTAKESRFGNFWNAVPLTFSSVLFHQLMLHKMKVDAQEELRMRFYVGRKEVRFGVLEFALITGLDFSSGPTEEEKAAQVARSGSDRLINRYFNRSDSVKTEALQLQFTNCQNPEDLYKLGLCLFVESVLLGREANALITPHILRYVEDLEFFFRIPWGKHSFARLMHSLQKDMLKQKANYEKKLSSDVQHECKYTAYGFAPAVQYWAYEAILEVGKRYGTNHGIRFPRMLSWTSKGDIGKKDVSALFSRRNLEVVKGLLPRTEEEAFVRTISYDGVENLVDDVVDDTEAEAPDRGPRRDPSTPPPAASPPVEEDEVFPDDYDPYEGAPATPIEAQPLIHHIDAAMHMLRRRRTDYPLTFPQKGIILSTFVTAMMSSAWTSHKGPRKNFKWEDYILDYCRGAHKNGKFPILTPEELKQEPDVGIVTPEMQKVFDAQRAFERERCGNEFRYQCLTRDMKNDVTELSRPES
ncbi:uncharacterized protein LOC133036592 [Cannabis sativa]|uniref:uncharacterized protein LOC133036592 n=1 Tax=Cannabis sativa TaxID=3483 RepID=UPI0029CA6FFB|nr:uncharacterized protein LOC133036592 [Cannabis sativa]